jgi:biopolymer transport protein ExbD
MAELQQKEQKRSGIRKGKKLSTRVDLTPMVDLGFLLITFFIFTTAMNEPSAIFMPIPKDDSKDQSLVGEEKTISLLLDGDDEIRYFHGNNFTSQGHTNYSAKGLRTIIQQKIAAVKTRFGQKAEPVVIIHPLATSRYGNLVDVLDEMMINGIRKYVLVDNPPEPITN